MALEDRQDWLKELFKADPEDPSLQLGEAYSLICVSVTIDSWTQCIQAMPECRRWEV